jgi:uncharacterized protein (DUF362 family)
MIHAPLILHHGPHRVHNITQVLTPLATKIAWQDYRHILIKPNFVATDRQLPSTHPEALRAVLEFVRAHYNGRLTIAEGSALTNTWEGFRNFGLPDMARQYEAALLDLNSDETISVQVYNRHLKPMILRLARTVVDSDFRISVGPPKTHDTVIVTLSLKNMIMGSLVNRRVAGTNGHQPHAFYLGRLLPRFLKHAWLFQYARARLKIGQQSDKMAMHQSYPVINLNLALLAPWVKPHLAIIDGFQAMEGAGPIHGDPVAWQIACAGTDALALDCLVARLMGFAPMDIGYLNYCARLGVGTADTPVNRIQTNTPLAQLGRSFRPHPTYPQQRQWPIANVEQWLKTAPVIGGRLYETTNAR